MSAPILGSHGLLRRAAFGASLLLLIPVVSALAHADWRPVVLSGERLPCLAGVPLGEIAVLACREICAAIPFQADERDAAGDFVLDQGPRADASGSADGRLDAADEIVVMAVDMGRAMRAEELPKAAICAQAVHVRGTATDGWFYVLAMPRKAPRSPRGYVRYDPLTDVMVGHRVAIGFAAATPRSLRLRDSAGSLGPDLLDRLKVRASARFFGILPLGRDEDDIESRYVAWRVGPIRVIRREEKWVRLAFGLRTPIFRTDTTFYRDYVELPVHLRLNFPPAHYFGAIEVSAILDFIDLRGWRLRVPGQGPDALIGAVNEDQRQRLERFAVDWAALEGPRSTLVLALDLGPTLSTLDRRLIYREEDDRWRSPEDARGEFPGVGFRLRDWGQVDRGHHSFTATSYALPAGYDLDRFARERREPWSIDVIAVAPSR